MSHEESPLSMPSCMHELTRSGSGDAPVVTVRSNEYWIASTQAPCFSCARFATVLGLLFPAGSAISAHGEPEGSAQNLQSVRKMSSQWERQRWCKHQVRHQRDLLSRRGRPMYVRVVQDRAR